MGATDRLLNADHEEVYFKGMPTYKGVVCHVDLWNIRGLLIPFSFSGCGCFVATGNLCLVNLVD